MCLAIPGKIIDKKGNLGIVDYDGARIDVRLDLVDAEIGDYVIVHTGFAIEKLSEESAKESIELWRQIEELNR
ncbi:MAG: HypC/HybG/HupF family hydrogenase formation chaperone [Candidatus Methanofastidiosia archaeon]